MQCHSLPCLAPASYARTLLCLRWASQSACICISPDESRFDPAQYEKHRACKRRAAAPSTRRPPIARSSPGLCIFASMRVQREIASALAKGWRRQRSMARGGSCPIPEPPLEVPSHAPSRDLTPADIVGGPWSAFASRHERMHANRTNISQPPSHAFGTS